MGLKGFRDDFIDVYDVIFVGGFDLSEVGLKIFCILCEKVVIGICVDEYVSF